MQYVLDQVNDWFHACIEEYIVKESSIEIKWSLCKFGMMPCYVIQFSCKSDKMGNHRFLQRFNAKDDLEVDMVVETLQLLIEQRKIGLLKKRKQESEFPDTLPELLEWARAYSSKGSAEDHEILNSFCRKVWLQMKDHYINHDREEEGFDSKMAEIAMAYTAGKCRLETNLRIWKGDKPKGSSSS